MANSTLLIPIIFAVILPVGLVIWWKKRTGAKIWCFFAGAICFVLFATILEPLLHSVILLGNNAVSDAINNSNILYMLYGAFAAGIFEETGRLFGFKLLLKKRYEKETAVAYGIGHGGIEVIMVLGMSYLVYFLATAGVPIADEETISQVVIAANTIQLNAVLVAMFERISAVMLHIGLSMIMFVAAKADKKLWLFPVSICMHAIADMMACLYQREVVTSLFAVEAVTFVIAVAVLFLGKRVLDANADDIEAKAPKKKLHIKIRHLEDSEKQEALDLSWEVFQKFEAPEYSEEGIREFKKSLDDKERTAMLKYYGAYDGDKLVGTICMREPQHIGGFFVKADYQGLGIGRELFEYMKKEYEKKEFTVNSSPYAVEIYRKLGFVPTDSEQVVSGLRFTPMEYKES